MSKVNIKKFENFANSKEEMNVAGMQTSRDVIGNQRSFDQNQTIKSISENQEIQNKLSMLDLDEKIEALQELSKFNKEVFENNDPKMERFGKILDKIGLTLGAVLSIIGAPILLSGGNITPVLLGLIGSAVISAIGYSIYKKSN
jgi:hypothetical protein